MANLYGIDSESDCREKLGELLELLQRARQTLNKETMSALKSSLEALYRKGNSAKGEARMSSIERQYFWPAISEAFVWAPSLGSPAAWPNGLDEIEYKLNKCRPKGA